MTAIQDTITPEIVSSHGLSPEEYEKVISILGREPNLVELGIFSVMWSEHCSYKSTRKHIKTLPTSGPQVICGPGENAGIVDIGDGQAAIFKMESHNHPSYIEPYQGAATGVGGIIRDVFTMGARPVALLNALRFGALEHPKTRYLVEGVVAGIGGYGNCVGVPTVGGETNFDPAYNGNILVNAMCVGVANADSIFYSAAAEVGGAIFYAGAKTGRDGIHGATMASEEFSDETESKRPTVQVGDPFTEKLLIEACLELMQKDAIIAIQDMGAAGLTCSTLEMASKGGTGVELNLDNVPIREKNMTAYEIMLSESQERMLMVLKPEKIDVAKEVFDKWDIDAAVVGEITDTERMVVKQHSEVVADMPVQPLADEAPVYDRAWKPTVKQEEPQIETETSFEELIVLLKRMLSSPNLCSKSWIWEQYDWRVMNDTVSKPGSSDASIVRVHGTDKAIAATSDCTPRYCKKDPIEGGKQAVAEAWRNLVASGAKPLAITNCLNFGNPEKPEIMGQIIGCIQGMKEACEALDFPVVSGNASLYNETDGNAILPTPAIGGVGLISTLDHATTIGFKAKEQTIIRIGDMEGHLGASLYMKEILDEDGGTAPEVDLELEKRNGEFIQLCIQKGWITACHDISDGGQMVAIAEMAMAGDMGATLNVAADVGRAFGEDQARYIITATHEMTERILTRAPESGVTATVIGETGGDALVMGEAKASVAELKHIHQHGLGDYMAAEHLSVVATS